jgi:phage shock protein A
MASGALDDVTGTQRDDIQAELDQMRGGQDVELELERLKGEIGTAPAKEIESGPATGDAEQASPAAPAEQPRAGEGS